MLIDRNHPRLMVPSVAAALASLTAVYTERDLDDLRQKIIDGVSDAYITEHGATRIVHVYTDHQKKPDGQMEMQLDG